MAINIKIGSGGSSGNLSGDKEKPKVEPNKVENITHKLNIRKSLDGNLYIYSHQNLDLVIDQKKSKLLAMSTDQKYDDKIYDAQNRLFKYLTKKGIIDPATVKMGNVYGVLEGVILTPENENVNRYDILLLNLAKWIEDEMPSFVEKEYRKKERVEDLTDPDEDESTELGKIRHKDTQGAGTGAAGQAGSAQDPTKG